MTEQQPGSFSIPVLTLRALFLACAVGIAAYVAQEHDGITQFWALLTAMGLALFLIAVDSLAIARSDIGTVSAIVFGLLVGFLAGQLFTGIVTLMGDFESEEGKAASNIIRMVVTLVFCYLGPIYILRTKDDFRFIVPYVEFRRQPQESRPLVLDTSAIIDGRINDLARTHLFDAPFLVPRFVVEELQHLADQSNRHRRERGRRGLDRLRVLQELPGTRVDLVQAAHLTGEVDRRLVELTRAREGKLITVDYNLQKVCELEGVQVINLNELATAIRMQFVPGDTFQLEIVRPGEGSEQGVGYLSDGTMVVVEGARKCKGQHVTARVTSSLQSSAGRMVFAKLDKQSSADKEDSPAPESSDTSTQTAESSP